MTYDEKSRTEIGKIATDVEALSERFSEASAGLSGQRKDVQAAERGFKKLAALLRSIADDQPERELNRRPLADAPVPGDDAQEPQPSLD